MNTLDGEETYRVPRTFVEVSPDALGSWPGRGTVDEIKDSAKKWAKKLEEIIDDVMTLTVITTNSEGNTVYVKTEIKLDGDWNNYLSDNKDWHVEYHKESVKTAVDRRDALLKTIADILNILSKIPF